MHTTSTSSGIGIEIPATERRRAPVFVVGCHRSGTNLLYDTLLSAGGFALYRGYLPIYKMLIPKFGRIDDPGNRAKIVQAWMHSKGFRRSGLDAKMLSSDLFANCRSGGDFMRTVMDKIATDQGVPRWAVYDPDNVLYMSRIKADLPGALFLHIVRDGRDVALSLRKWEAFARSRGHEKPAACRLLRSTGSGWSSGDGNGAGCFPRIIWKSAMRNW